MWTMHFINRINTYRYPFVCSCLDNELHKDTPFTQSSITTTMALISLLSYISTRHFVETKHVRLVYLLLASITQRNWSRTQIHYSVYAFSLLHRHPCCTPLSYFDLKVDWHHQAIEMRHYINITTTSWIISIGFVWTMFQGHLICRQSMCLHYRKAVMIVLLISGDMCQKKSLILVVCNMYQKERIVLSEESKNAWSMHDPYSQHTIYTCSHYRAIIRITQRLPHYPRMSKDCWWCTKTWHMWQLLLLI